MKKYKIYLNKNIKYNIILFLVTVSIGVLSVISISLIKDIINEGIIGKNNVVLHKNMIQIIIIAAVLLLLNLVLPVLKNIAYWKGMTNFIDVMISRVFKADYSKMFIKKESSKLWTDINMSTSYTCMYFDALINMIYRVIKFLIYFSVLISIDFYASITIVIVFIINSVFINKIKKKVQYYQQQFLITSQNLSSRIIEYINLIRNIKAKNKENYFIKRIDKSQHELNNNIIKNSLIQDISHNLIGFISNVTPIIAVILIISLSNKEFTSAGNIVVVYSYIPLVLSSLQEIYASILQLLSSKPYLKSINDLIDIEIESLGNVNISKFEKLEVKDLEVCLDNKVDIKIQDFNINKGEKILICGESGCGKTTLFNILTGFIKEYTGTIKVNNINLKMLKLSDLRKIFGISFQENRVFNLSLEEAIKLSTTNSIDNVLKICEIEEFHKHNDSGCLNADKLSGGEKARINLAQSLIREPDVLFIDESLSALDEEMEIRILKNIIKTYRGITIIYISHRKTSNQLFDKKISLSIK